MGMDKSRIFGWLAPGLGALAMAGALLAWQWPVVTPGSEEAVPGSGDTDLTKSTADLVEVVAVRDAEDRTRVTLLIDGDWHVNANPASLDFLIPTELSVSAGGRLPLKVDYPRGRDMDSGLGDATWSVYDDGVVMSAVLLEEVPYGQLTAEVRVQACHDSGRCLAPDTLLTRIVTP